MIFWFTFHKGLVAHKHGNSCNICHLWEQRVARYCYFPYIKIYVMYILVNLAVLWREQTKSVALVRERTIPTERPPPVGEVSANFMEN
jgi:hypothetical protein